MLSSRRMLSKPIAPIFCFLSVFYIFSCQNVAQTGQEAVASGSQKTGAAIFNDNCKLCHGADGRLGLNGAKDLTLSKMPFHERVNIITHGKKLMTPFGSLLKPVEIDSVAAYTLKLSK
jgi:cytochrome c6